MRVSNNISGSNYNPNLVRRGPSPAQMNVNINQYGCAAMVTRASRLAYLRSEYAND